MKEYNSWLKKHFLDVRLFLIPLGLFLIGLILISPTMIIDALLFLGLEWLIIWCYYSLGFLYKISSSLDTDD